MCRDPRRPANKGEARCPGHRARGAVRRSAPDHRLPDVPELSRRRHGEPDGPSGQTPSSVTAVDCVRQVHLSGDQRRLRPLNADHTGQLPGVRQLDAEVDQILSFGLRRGLMREPPAMFVPGARPSTARPPDDVGVTPGRVRVEVRDGQRTQSDHGVGGDRFGHRSI